MSLNSRRIKPERFFLILAFLFGFLFVFVTPPFQVPDEPAHFYKAYQVSKFSFLGEKQADCASTYNPISIVTVIGKKKGNCSGDYIPISIVTMANDLIGNIPSHPENKVPIEKVLRHLNEKADLDVKDFCGFPNTVIYSPIVYMPQSVGIGIARIFNCSPLVMFYAGRLFNLLAFILIVYFSIKIIPFFKWGLVLIALMPMTIFEVASLSADPVCYAISFFLFAFILKYAFDDDTKKVTRAAVFKIASLGFLLGLCKFSYVLLPFLFLLIPVKRFNSKKVFFSSFLFIVFSSFIGFVIWSFLTKKIYIPIWPYVDLHKQVYHILTHPLAYLSAITSDKTLNMYLLHSVVGNLGWLDTHIPDFLLNIYIWLVILYALFEKKKVTVMLYQKAIILLVTVFSFLLVITMIYMSWNKVGADSIDGLQGRYFIPIIPLFLVLFYNKSSLFTTEIGAKIYTIIVEQGRIFLPLYIIFLLFVSLLITISRFYSITILDAFPGYPYYAVILLLVISVAVFLRKGSSAKR
ncbi:MAG: DUF2142 domain-containing protein [Paludibacteraceae bacterium]|nr:DUF2142 domain-containing protein [Paludibacteraceae bacterium]